MKPHKKIIIAIDGHSSSGKSTVAKQLAKKLSYIYIDSGAMYRAVTLYCLRNGLVKNGEVLEEKLRKEMDNINVSFIMNPSTGIADTYLNGENAENEIREIEVSNMVSPVSRIGFVREAMVKLQRDFGKKKGIVMDGRDIGTVVYPDAELKIFMTASPEVRAKRRFDELKAKGSEVSYEEILANVRSRDHIDSNREHSPLRQADDAVLLDNSNMSREEQLEWILDLIKKKFPGII
jgi:cytidylate kinase